MYKTASLIPDAFAVIVNKSTEAPFMGKYTDSHEKGTWLCRQCGLALFRSDSKFASGCGWPSFFASITDHVKESPDADGRRTEILCKRCNAHLGHVFRGEGFTKENLRHCVNSCSLDFVTDLTVADTEEAIFAAGCFWGVESLFKQLKGVVGTEVGYTGGHVNNPSYQDVCRGDTGHFEAIRVLYDPRQIDFESITKYFFEIHDFTQANGQGPDIGEQYQSAVFVYDEQQKQIVQSLIQQLQNKNVSVATQIFPAQPFWPAEAYHQLYYEKNGKTPYCHVWTKRF
ncbi:MAG: bifunctional methionine sulfoxide reductase B/A protein [Gammaproteobacteria bacterium]|nr:bifunctional methionine sulfoxide reductase B/A protein [Gammaproteobacteria bacterium]